MIRNFVEKHPELDRSILMEIQEALNLLRAACNNPSARAEDALSKNFNARLGAIVERLADDDLDHEFVMSANSYIASSSIKNKDKYHYIYIPRAETASTVVHEDGYSSHDSDTEYSRDVREDALSMYGVKELEDRALPIEAPNASVGNKKTTPAILNKR